MENTTKMQIEHVVIGMQTSLIILFIMISLNSELIDFLLQMSSVIVFIIVIPIAYALGILIDRICDYFLFSEKKEKKIKRKICIEMLSEEIRKKELCQENENCGMCRHNQFSKQVWKKWQELEYYNDAMTRKRILRATCLNCGLGEVAILFLWSYGKRELIDELGGVLSSLLFLIGVSCYLTYWKFVQEYYQKQRSYHLASINHGEEGNG